MRLAWGLGLSSEDRLICSYSAQAARDGAQVRVSSHFFPPGGMMCPHMRTVLDSYCPLRIGGYDSEDEVRKPPAPGGAPGAAARVAGASPHGRAHVRLPRPSYSAGPRGSCRPPPIRHVFQKTKTPSHWHQQAVAATLLHMHTANTSPTVHGTR